MKNEIKYYILDKDGRTPKLVDHDAWLRWYTYHIGRNKLIETIQVAWDPIDDTSYVSTVFLHYNLYFEKSPFGNAPPFETMWFGPDGCKVIDRYQTWAEALNGHLGFLAGVIHGAKDSG